MRSISLTSINSTQQAISATVAKSGALAGRQIFTGRALVGTVLVIGLVATAVALASIPRARQARLPIPLGRRQAARAAQQVQPPAAPLSFAELVELDEDQQFQLKGGSEESPHAAYKKLVNSEEIFSSQELRCVCLADLVALAHSLQQVQASGLEGELSLKEAVITFYLHLRRHLQTSNFNQLSADEQKLVGFCAKRLSLLKLTDLKGFLGMVSSVGEASNKTLICHLRGQEVELEKAALCSIHGQLPRLGGSEDELRRYYLQYHCAHDLDTWSSAELMAACRLKMQDEPASIELMNCKEYRHYLADRVLEAGDQPLTYHCLLHELFDNRLQELGCNDEDLKRLRSVVSSSIQINLLNTPSDERLQLAQAIKNGWIDGYSTLGDNQFKVIKETGRLEYMAKHEISYEAVQELLGDVRIPDDVLRKDRTGSDLRIFLLNWNSTEPAAWVKWMLPACDSAALTDAHAECLWHVTDIRCMRSIVIGILKLEDQNLRTRLLAAMKGAWTHTQYVAALQDADKEHGNSDLHETFLKLQNLRWCED